MKVKKISEFLFEIPMQKKMIVPGWMFLSDDLFENVDPGAMEQLSNISSLPGIELHSIGLPDMHYGYGAPIGSVAAFNVDEGGVSPGMCGFDINCGIRLLRTNLDISEVKPKLKKLLNEIFRLVPVGVGKHSKLKLTREKFLKILRNGAQFMIENGYGFPEDENFIEENGRMKTNLDGVSEKSISRGIRQIGTLGAGNHFIEIQYVDKLFDEKISKIFGLEKNEVVVMIHTGSRGFGHQVATDYIKTLIEKYPKIAKSIPDRELIYAPSGSKEEKLYLDGMKAAANFAWANRQMISHLVRTAFKNIIGTNELPLVYDLSHNIIKKRKHFIGDKKKEVYVHRKGATRAFGPNEPEVPKRYKSAGQPVLLPGSMGTESYVMVGTELAMKQTFGSIAHGAGRTLSRNRALKRFSDNQILKELTKKGILAHSASKGILSEEAPEAYKDVSEVVRVCEGAGIAKNVARLKPMGVVKG